MDEKTLQQWQKQIDQFNEDCQFHEAIAFIEAIPPEVRTLEMQVDYAFMFNHIAMFELDEDDPQRALLIEKAIALLDALREQGEHDVHWNTRMAYALY